MEKPQKIKNIWLRPASRNEIMAEFLFFFLLFGGNKLLGDNPKQLQDLCRFFWKFCAMFVQFMCSFCLRPSTKLMALGIGE
jgi:hypothetical protein